jgi:hypothetical protein
LTPPQPRYRKRFAVSAVALIGLFLVDLGLTRSMGITLFQYYWIPVVLAASFATPRQVGWFTSLAIVLTVIWSLQAPRVATLELMLRLAGLIGMAWVSMHLSRELQGKERSNRELKEHYQLLAENAPDVVLSSDPKAGSPGSPHRCASCSAMTPVNCREKPSKHCCSRPTGVGCGRPWTRCGRGAAPTATFVS